MRVRTVDPAAMQVIICEGVGAIAGAAVRCVFSPLPRTRCVTNAPWLRWWTRSARTGNAGRRREEGRCSPKSRRIHATVDFIYDSARRSGSHLKIVGAQCLCVSRSIAPTPLESSLIQALFYLRHGAGLADSMRSLSQ